MLHGNKPQRTLVRTIGLTTSHPDSLDMEKLETKPGSVCALSELAVALLLTNSVFKLDLAYKQVDLVTLANVLSCHTLRAVLSTKACPAH